MRSRSAWSGGSPRPSTSPCGVIDGRRHRRATDRTRGGGEACGRSSRAHARGEAARRRASPGPQPGGHDPEGHQQARPRQAARQAAGMSEPRRIELTLLGQTLTIRSEAAPDYLRRLAKYLEERVGQLKRSGVADPVTALSLAALDITDELFKAREDTKTDAAQVGARLGALVALLDKVAPPESGSDR